MTSIAKSTRHLFKHLYEGVHVRQGDVGRLIWKINHPRVATPKYINSYWHGALENHVSAGRILKKATKSGTTYRISHRGRRFAEKNGIV